MSRAHEIRVGSAPTRSYLNTSSSLSSSYEREEVTQRGYLNRKCEGSMGRKTKVLHREKNWQLYWCNLKGTQLELFKIDGLKLKPGEPPPKDIIPPTSLMKGTKVELMNMDGALVELDYVSQENKDIQKRRKFLFRVVSQNDVEYIMQAPNLNLRKTWVSSLQAVAHNMPVEEDMMLGHAIKASRDSIKHIAKNLHRNKRSSIMARSTNTSGSLVEESDYVEFSTAEAMVAAGGDPRLQALRKRLQAKKELLKQLNRMYTSFLGGNAAAMYDETLILAQLEPPTFDSGSPLFDSAPAQTGLNRKQKNTSQVVHRKLAVSDSAIPEAKSLDSDSNRRSLEGVVNEEDRRASIGDVRPAVLTSVSPLPPVRDDAVETELLMDYYLVPGAEWSLVKKGETVQIIGKTRDTGWYRCMALRDSKVKLDNAPFSFLSKSMAIKTRRQSGITPEMIEEEYSQDLSLSSNTLEEAEDEGIEMSSPPPPLMPRFPQASFCNTRQYSTEDLFPTDMEMGPEEQDSRLLDIAECSAKLSNRDSTDNDTGSKQDGGLTVHSQQLSSGPSPDLSEVSSVSQEDSKMFIPASESDAVEKEESGEGHASLERRRSYQMATDDEVLDSPIKTPDSKEHEKVKVGDGKADTIKRSSSSVENSSQATIKLRRSLESAWSPRATSTSVYSGSLYQSALERLSSNAKDSAYFSLKTTSPTSLDHMIDREVNTSPYPTPLIGCIPPSALKCFAEKKGAGTSPAHQPDISASESGGSQSRPVSDGVEMAPDQSTTGQSPAGAVPSEPGLEDSATSGRKYTNARMIAIRDRSDSKCLNVSMSLDDDSDGEADRRHALMFKKHDTVDPSNDNLRKGHTRAKSLPPPVHLRIDTPPEEGVAGDDREDEEIAVESSLDRRPSYLRNMPGGGAISPDPSVQMIPPCQSVGSSPLHRLQVNGRVSPKPGGEAPIGALFASPSKSHLLKKIFSRKSKSGSKLTTPEHTTSGRTSPGPPPGMLKQVLLGNKDPYYDEDYSRARLSSASGRPVLQKGMGIVIGEESSSESEEEEEEEEEEEGESSLASSLCVDPESSLFISARQNSPSNPTSPSLPAATDQEQLFLSLDQTKLEESMRARRARTPDPGLSLGRLKRSASDHDSLKLKAQDDHCLQAGSTSSLKRNIHMSTALFPKKSRLKPRAMTTPGEATQQQQSIKKNRLSKKKKNKSLLASNEVESGEGPATGAAADQDTSIKISGIFRNPPRGEKRFVYLDPILGKYGFRLQSYGRIRDQGKVLQTFVQSVVPGSPSFMAGLYPGDAIVEVNGKDVKYAPVEEVVEAIQEGGKAGERVALLVEFVDGVTRLECMRKSDEFKNDIKTRQRRLEELCGSEQSVHLNGSHLLSPQHLTLASQLPVWSSTCKSFEAVQHKFPYKRQLNEIVAVHSGAINSLGCDVLVMPISSCHKPKDSTDKNILLQLLCTGGPELMDDLSLAKQCKIGENISTWGHALPAKYVYHCVFGDLEESLQSCCHHAMESALADKLKTVVFWLDGFASLSVSPHLVIDAVRNWTQQDMNRNVFDRVIFSSKANSSLVEKLMHESFPLYPTTTRDSGSSFTATQEDGSGLLQNGTESVQSESLKNGAGSTQNGIESSGLVLHNGDTQQNGTELRQEKTGSLQNGGSATQDFTFESSKKECKDSKLRGDLSTEDLLESLDAIQDENMKTFEELVGKLAAMAPEPVPDRLKRSEASSSHQDFFSQSLPSHYQGGDFFGSVSPTSRSSHNRSQSGDHILNPDRMESDV